MMLDDPPQRTPEIHIHNDAVQAGPLSAIPAAVKTIAGVPTDKLVVIAIIIGVLAVVGATFYSTLFLLPAADERRRIDSDRQQQAWHDASVRSLQEEAERNREMIRNEGLLNRSTREMSDKIQASSILTLAQGMGELKASQGQLQQEIVRLEVTIKELIKKQEAGEPVIRP